MNIDPKVLDLLSALAEKLGTTLDSLMQLAARQFAINQGLLLGAGLFFGISSLVLPIVGYFWGRRGKHRDPINFYGAGIVAGMLSVPMLFTVFQRSLNPDYYILKVLFSIFAGI